MTDPRRRAFLRFLVTGVVVNGVLFGVLAVLLHLGVDYRVAATLTYVMGMVWGYVQNRIWSWQSRSPLFRSASTYLGVYACVYVAHIGAVTALVEVADVKPIIAALFSAAGLVIPLFVVIDRLVFPKERT